MSPGLPWRQNAPTTVPEGWAPAWRPQPPIICPICGRTYGGGVPDARILAAWWAHHRQSPPICRKDVP